MQERFQGGLECLGPRLGLTMGQQFPGMKSLLCLWHGTLSHSSSLWGLGAVLHWEAGDVRLDNAIPAGATFSRCRQTSVPVPQGSVVQ